MSVVNVKWIEGRFMVGADSNGHSITICNSAERDPVWLGVRPAEMLLLAAASCSMYDVIDILEKQHEPLEGLEVTCSGEKQTEPIYKFERIHLHYKAKGKIDAKKLERAIQLSQDKYCTVTNTIKGSTEVSFDYEVE